MAEKKAAPTVRTPSAGRAQGCLSAVQEGDVRLAAGLARDRVRRLYLLMSRVAIPRIGGILAGARNASKATSQPRSG